MTDNPNSVVEREATEYAAFCMNANLGAKTELYQHPYASYSVAMLNTRAIANECNKSYGHTIYDLDAIEIRKRTVRITTEFGPWTVVQGYQKGETSMKNVRPEMLKNCIFMFGDEYKRLVASLTNGEVEVEFCCDGINYCEPDGVEWSNVYYDAEDINSMLSKHFDVSVTSVHIDTCDFVGVWVCYTGLESHKEG